MSISKLAVILILSFGCVMAPDESSHSSFVLTHIVPDSIVSCFVPPSMNGVSCCAMGVVNLRDEDVTLSYYGYDSVAFMHANSDLVSFMSLPEFPNAWGEFLGAQSAGGDTVALLFLRGFALVVNTEIIGQWALQPDIPDNYYMVCPQMFDTYIARLDSRLYFLIGGEWEYPKKRYHSDMRFIYEFDIDTETGRVLDFVHPDFGEQYSAIRFTNLSAANGHLLVSYASESEVYECDFATNSLNRTPLQVMELPARSTTDGINFQQFSDFIALGNDVIARVGAVHIPKTTNLQSGMALTDQHAFVDYFTSDFQSIGRAMVSSDCKDFGAPMLQGNQVFWRAKCIGADSVECTALLSANARDGLAGLP